MFGYTFRGCNASLILVNIVSLLCLEVIDVNHNPLTESQCEYDLQCGTKV